MSMNLKTAKMEIKSELIQNNKVYKTFRFEKLDILICYNNDTKDINYISIITNKSNRLGKQYQSFDIALNHYKQAYIKQAIEKVNTYCQNNIKVTNIEYNTLEIYSKNPILFEIGKTGIC